MVMEFSVAPNRWAAPTRTLLLRTVFAMILWACAHWRRQDEGMDWVLCLTGQCRIWVTRQRALCGPSNLGRNPSVSSTLIRKVLSKMKYDKGAGPSGIMAEMLKSAAEEGVKLARQMTEAVFNCGVVSNSQITWRTRLLYLRDSEHWTDGPMVRL